MSAYSPLTTQYNDKECLVAALEEMGYTTVEVHEIAQPLVGYHGDLRADTAEIIVRRRYVGGSSNDIGFKKQSDGTYSAIISDFDKHKHDTKWLDGLKVSYTTHRITREAKKRGLILKSNTIVNGKRVIKYIKQGV